MLSVSSVVQFFSLMYHERRMNAGASFPGRKPQRGTSWLVRLTDILARVFITVGGIGTIVAVTLVCVFLIWVVVPLFRGASVSGERHLTEGGALVREQPVREGVDVREVIGARLWGGLTFDEVARLVGCSLATAHRRFQAGLTELRMRLEGQWIPDPKT